MQFNDVFISNQQKSTLNENFIISNDQIQDEELKQFDGG